MSRQDQVRIGYVVKRYPRFSETFIVNEVLAHERAGWNIHIFSLLPPCDAHFQENISRVRAPVTYLPAEKPKGSILWRSLRDSLQRFAQANDALARAESVTAQEVNQSIALARHVGELRIEHLHAHFVTSAATVARLASQIAGTRYTLTAHAKDIFHADVKKSELGEKIADSCAVVTVSDFNVNHLKSQFSQHAAKISRVYNGLNLRDFPFNASQDRRPCIVAVGRLVEKKGFADLIEACALLAKRGQKFTCHIVGDGPLRSQLERQIADHDILDVVQLVGAVPQHEVIQLVQQAALLAAPCVTAVDGDRDGLPTVVLEAMAVGTTCVGTDVTGLPEVLRDGETGLVAPPGNTSVLAAKISKLLETREIRNHIAANARALIERHFDIDRNTAQLRGLFRQGTMVGHQPVAGKSACSAHEGKVA